jgi:hypothetical protein
MSAGVPQPRMPQLQMHRAGRATIGLLVFLSIGALAGGIALVSRPDGSVMHFETSLLAGSPFSDFFYPGLILGGLFGVGSLVVALLGWRRAPIAPFLAFAIGGALMIWIVVELLIIKELSFLHPTYFAIGALISAASMRWGRPVLAAWRGRAEA